MRLTAGEGTPQEVRYAPWLPAVIGMTAGAVLFAAGAAFAKLICF